MKLIVNNIMQIFVSYKTESFLLRILLPGFGNQSIKQAPLLNELQTINFILSIQCIIGN